MKNAKFSLMLLVGSGIVFFIAIVFSEVDSAFRWGLIIASLLAVPISFFFSTISLIKEKNKRSQIMSLITVIISGAIMLLGVYKIF